LWLDIDWEVTLTKNHSFDPRGLIAESYRMEQITESECRSIFLDWVLGIPDGQSQQEHIRQLLGYYQSKYPDHPTTKLLLEGLRSPQPRRKRKQSRLVLRNTQNNSD